MSGLTFWSANNYDIANSTEEKHSTEWQSPPPVQQHQYGKAISRKLHKARHKKVDVEITSWDEGARIKSKAIVDKGAGKPEKPLNDGFLAQIWSAKKVS